MRPGSRGFFPRSGNSRTLKGCAVRKILSGDPMALVYPFRAFRYNPQVAPFERVLTQPYDKISPAQQEKYYAADPHNLITIEKGRVFAEDGPQNNVYTRAAAAMDNWIVEHAVAQDPSPAFYAYSQQYAAPGGSLRQTRRGFIGAGRLEDYAREI